MCGLHRRVHVHAALSGGAQPPRGWGLRSAAWASVGSTQTTSGGKPGTAGVWWASRLSAGRSRHCPHPRGERQLEAMMVSGTLAQASLLLADLHHNPDSARSSRAEFPASWGGGGQT